MSNNSISGFSQQGQLDYMALGGSLVSGANQVLQRFADAGIQPMTHQAGLAISMQFRLDELGTQRVRDALNRIRPYHGFESILWFGFGHKSYLALLVDQELGLNCAALCACLGETYGAARAAQLLQALWKTYDFPDNLEPSRSQYRALVSNCSGFLLSTHFPDIVQRMAGPYKDDYVLASIKSTTSTDLAKALNALFQISKGTLTAIEVHGGCDIAFLAAVAYWLLDLDVWVQLHDGSIIFSNCIHREQAKVRLHYADVDGTQSSLIQIAATTFVLRSVEDLITDDPYSPITFRTNWDACVSGLFYNELEAILGQAALLGKVLGAVARIHQAIATCELDVGGLSRTHFINFQPRGYGISFIQSINTLLPELGSIEAFQEGAKDSLRQSVAQNVTSVQALIGQLKAECFCRICAGNNNSFSRYRSCNVAVVLFLRYIVDIMAHVNCDLPINPTRNGLECAYSSQLRIWNSFQHAQVGQERSILGVVMGIPHASDLSAGIPYSHPRAQSFLLDYILDAVFQLFIGRGAYTESTQTGKPQCTALSRAGICIWLDALRSANTDPGSMSTVHLVPGQIMYKNRNYDSVWDLSKASDEIYLDMPVAEFGSFETSTILPMQGSRIDPQLQALATEAEAEGTILFAYKVNSSNIARYLQPGILTEELLVSSARAPCPKAMTCSDDLSIPFYSRRSGWGFMLSTIRNISFDNDGAFILWKATDPISKLLAIEGCRMNSWKTTGGVSSLIITPTEQCMACLARYWYDSKQSLVREHSAYIGAKKSGGHLSLPCFIHVI